MDASFLAIGVGLVVVLFLYLIYSQLHTAEKVVKDKKDDKSETFVGTKQDPNFIEPMKYKEEVANINSDSWMDLVKEMDLDPSVRENHQEFVKDVTRFSSGANFTNVADDNTSWAFTNFQGLRRPSHVNIGASARQVPDIDETVLQRNKPFRFN